MATQAEVVKQWGEDNLVRVPEVLLGAVDLPAACKDFLARAGLPKRFHLFSGLEFEALPMSRLPAQGLGATERFLLQRLGGTPFLLLLSAEVRDYFLCVQEGAGNVRLVDIPLDGSGVTSTFVNSGVQAWLECLTLYTSWVSSEGEPTRAGVRRFKKHLERVDPRAFEEDNCYWSAAVEDALNYLEA